MDEQLPEGVNLPIVWTGADDVPVVFANQSLGQVGQQGEVILTFGQLVPPAILGVTEEDRERQIRNLTHIPIKPVARLAFTRTGLEELVGLLHKTLENHDRAQELAEQIQRMTEEGDGQ